MAKTEKPTVIITGAAGSIGQSLVNALSAAYDVIGMDRVPAKRAYASIKIDLSSDQSVKQAFSEYRRRYGERIAAVVHLAAYFDFSGEDHPLYTKVNIEGTRRLIRELRNFEVGRLVYAGTMLVHAPARLGEKIDEDAPIDPKWAYPQSKAESESVIRQEHGNMPYVLLHMAGIYDERTAVPTLAEQIARIYERSFKSHFYPGDPAAGQSLVHKADAIDAIVRAVDRRQVLPPETTILIGESDTVGFGELQDILGRLIHDDNEWPTYPIPKALAKTAAWAEEKAEPVIPDVIDHGEPPFIRPFMVDMSDDHYALDISRAKQLLDWSPRHSIRTTLPEIVEALKQDPAAWYKANRVAPPTWLASAVRIDANPEDLRARHEQNFRQEHQRCLWSHYLNMIAGTWLFTAPPLLGYSGTLLAYSDAISGAAVVLLSLLSLSWRSAGLRWVTAAVGLWVLFAPLAFWTPSAAGYLNSTLLGSLIIGFAVLVPPTPGISAAAALSGPTIPIGWDYNPSSWTQRIPIIFLAVIGFHISRYLTAYQLGHIGGVWDPYFLGGADPQNGTEEIITSSVSRAWPVPDAGIGALTYMLEILTGIIGSAQRWRTMPWLVVAFGLMVIPLGVVSIAFIIIQPVILGTWCALCLIAATAMLVQIPYSLDELVATCDFLRRRKNKGASLLRIFFVGDADEAAREAATPLERSPTQLVKEMIGGGVNMPWTLAASIVIGVWLMFTRITLDAAPPMANSDHIVGALVVTASAIACAEVGRSVRFVNIVLALGLLGSSIFYDVSTAQVVNSIICSIALIGLSLPRGPMRYSYGAWNRLIA